MSRGCTPSTAADLAGVPDQLGHLLGRPGVHDQPARRRSTPAAGGSTRRSGADDRRHRPQVRLVLAGHRLHRASVSSNRAGAAGSSGRYASQRSSRARCDGPGPGRGGGGRQLAAEPGRERVDDQFVRAPAGRASRRASPPARRGPGRRGADQHGPPAGHARIGGERRPRQDRHRIVRGHAPGVQVRADPGEMAEPAAVGVTDDHRWASSAAVSTARRSGGTLGTAARPCRRRAARWTVQCVAPGGSSISAPCSIGRTSPTVRRPGRP